MGRGNRLTLGRIELGTPYRCEKRSEEVRQTLQALGREFLLAGFFVVFDEQEFTRVQEKLPSWREPIREFVQQDLEPEEAAGDTDGLHQEQDRIELTIEETIDILAACILYSAMTHDVDVARCNIDRQDREIGEGGEHKLIGLHMLELGILSTSQLIAILRSYEENPVE